jgi:protease-4
VTKTQKLLTAAILSAPILAGIILYMGESSESKAGNPLKKIGLVRIVDEIMASEDYVRQLREMLDDKTIAGVIVRIDSPGGAVAPSQEIFAEMMRFRENAKPLVVSMGNIGASGAYYIAAPAMKIFANPGTITGSIGVIMHFPQYYKLLDKVGVKMQTIKSGAFKDIGSPDREITPAERIYLQQFIDDTYEQFIEDVSKARGMNLDTVRRIAEGRIYTGRQAVKAGLIDSLGGFQVALEYLRDYLDLPGKTKVIEKRGRANAFRDLFVEEFFDKLPIIRHFNRRGIGSYFLLESQ